MQSTVEVRKWSCDGSYLLPLHGTAYNVSYVSLPAKVRSSSNQEDVLLTISFVEFQQLIYLECLIVLSTAKVEHKDGIRCEDALSE